MLYVRRKRSRRRRVLLIILADVAFPRLCFNLDQLIVTQATSLNLRYNSFLSTTLGNNVCNYSAIVNFALRGIILPVPILTSGSAVALEKKRNRHLRVRFRQG